MPRNSLRNVARSAPTTPQPAPAAAPSMPELPQEVQSLLAEREQLEARMAALTGGGDQGAGQGDLRRFPVTPLPQRRAEDDSWARARDRRTPQSAGRPERADGVPRNPQTGQDPQLAERTGQRALQDRLGRFSKASAPPLRDLDAVTSALEDLPSSTVAPPPLPLRDLDTVVPKRMREKPVELPDKPLRNDPNLRDFAPKIPSPAEPMLRALKDRSAPALRKLDILRGGSGDLDNLRKTAFERMKEKREEERREERQKARRKAARDEQRREERRNRKKGKYD